MSINITPFSFEGFAVRTIQIDGEPWFVAADVCDSLTVATEQTRRLDEDEKGLRTVQTLGGPQDMLVINESGLYSLILTSRKPEAKRFKKWVTREVLPAIRKTGSYSIQPQALPNFSNPAEAARAWALEYEARQLAERTKAEIGTRREATAMNTASQAVKKATALERELDKAKDYASVKRMEMLYHGTRFNWRLLKSAAVEMGMPAIDVFDANYGTVKAYHASVWMEAYAVSIDAKECA